MTAFSVPRYLAETACRDSRVSGWIADLPAIVADLAGRWSLQVGEPFQPGGQCSWTAPVTDRAGAALVLKIGYRFPGGEERDEAAGLRLWDGNGAVRLHAALESQSAYALLVERCIPGTPLGQVLPEPEQDQVVTGLLRQLWALPPAPRTRSIRGSPGPGSRCSGPCPRPRAARCCCARTCTATTSSPRGGHPGWS